MPYLEQIETIKTKLESLKTNEIVAFKASEIEDLIVLLNSAAETIKNGYDIYFNDHDIDFRFGEGMNYIKGNGFCELIPQAFDYYKVRILLLNNIDEYTNGNNLVLSGILSVINNFENITIPDWNNKYEEYLQNFVPTPIVSPEGTTLTSPSVEDFWSKYNIESQFNAFTSSIKNKINECISAANTIKSEIVNWLQLGTEVSLNISLHQHINFSEKIDFNETTNLHQKITEKQEAISVYSSKIDDSITISNKIKTEYPEAPLNKQSYAIRDIVCSQMNVDEQSNTIYNNIKTALNSFLENVTEEE